MNTHDRFGNLKEYIIDDQFLIMALPTITLDDEYPKLSMIDDDIARTVALQV